MANPQPDIFLKWSKELWEALVKIRIPGVTRQVFDAIALLTYGANPSVKHTQIPHRKIAEMTELSQKTVSKNIKRLLDMNLVTQLGDLRPSNIGINKDFDSWIKSPKKVTYPIGAGLREVGVKPSHPIGGNNSPNWVTPKNPTYYTLEKEDTVDDIYEYYKKKINPKRKSRQRAIKNLHLIVKKIPPENLIKAIENYKTVAMDSDAQYRKDPANFFGRNEPYYLDYLPENFEPPEREGTDDRPLVEIEPGKFI